MKQMVFLFLCSVTLWGRGLDVSVCSKRATVVNADTGVVLFEKAAHERASPASITKLATALYALELVDIDFHEHVRCPQKCLVTVPKSVKQLREYKDPAYYLEPDGQSFNLVKGEEIPLGALFYGMMLASGNDAANVIANHIGGSIEGFIEGLNSYLVELGCTETHFANPHGLHFPDHYTTAHDIALFARKALENDLLRDIAKTPLYTRPQTNKSDEYEFKHTNRLLRKGDPYYYPRASGLKTGYIEDAGYCLAAVAEEDGRRLIAVLLGGETPADRYRDAIALFDAAFAEKPVSRALFVADEARFKHELKKGKRQLEAVLKEDCVISYFPSEEPEVTATIEWANLSLPVREGAYVGKLVMRDGRGVAIMESNLFAAKGVMTVFTVRQGLMIGAMVVFVILAAATLARTRSKNRLKKAPRGEQ